jgi:pyruvate dehydrogenase E2 component (dihydrolipoamide acetyltransferase)
MPRLSDSMEEGTVLKWLRSVGDEVAVGDELVEIETDKANMVYEADVAGTLTEVIAGEGETLAIGEVIARVGAPGELEDGGGGGGGEAPAAPTDGAEGAELGAPASSSTAVAVIPASGPDRDRRVKASPIARRLAQEHGLELAAVTGSGTGGRIVKADVEQALASGSASTQGTPIPEELSSAPSPAQAGNGMPLTSRPTPSAIDLSSVPAGRPEVPETTKGQVEVVEPTKLQRTVARRMAESKATAPHFYLQAEIDMTAAVAGRRRLKEPAADGAPVPTFNDMVVKACALALREHPRANGSYREGRFELHSRVNVGVAVAAQDALVVPTVFDADLKGLRQIATETKALASRVRNGEITPPELSGGTFTVSNLGMYGVSNFHPVINGPQAGILAVGELKAKPVVGDSGAIEPRQTMGVTLACDHRILYGADGAAFLRRVGALLEEPVGLAL